MNCRALLVIAIMAMAAMTACTNSSPRNDGTGRAFDRTPLSADAKTMLDSIDARMRIINDRTRPIAEIVAAEKGLLSDCESWATQVIGSNSKAENHVLYHLARLRFAWQSDRGTDPVISVLDQLDAAPAPIFRGQSRLLRIRALLRRGTRQQAESQIPGLQEIIPDFVPLARNLMHFHGLAGATTPAITGRLLQPARTPNPAAWRVYVFIPSIDTVALARIGQYLDVCGDGSRLRLHVVTFDESPLALTSFTKLRHATQADFWWCGTAEDARATSAAWRLVEASAVLAAADGTIMVCDAPPELAAALANGKFIR